MTLDSPFTSAFMNGSPAVFYVDSLQANMRAGLSATPRSTQPRVARPASASKSYGTPSPYLASTRQMTLICPGRIGSMPFTALRTVPSENVSSPMALHSAVRRATVQLFLQPVAYQLAVELRHSSSMGTKVQSCSSRTRLMARTQRMPGSS